MITTEREKHLFRIPEAEEYIGCSRAQIYRLIEAGELQRVKIGKSARIPRASLEAFVERLENESGESDVS